MKKYLFTVVVLMAARTALRCLHMGAERGFTAEAGKYCMRGEQSFCTDGRSAAY